MAAQEQTADQMEVLTNKLLEFRRDYPERSIQVNGTTWRYRVIGESSVRPFILLPGGELVNDLGFQFAAEMSSHYRVFYPAYSSVSSMEALVEGIIGILHAERLTKVSVLGASFGGYVAQLLLRKDPARIERLILSNTGVPQRYLVKFIQALTAITKMMPWSVMQNVLRRALRKLLGGSQDEQRFWDAYCRELLTARLSKERAVENMRQQRAFHQRFRFHPRDTDDWQGKMLLIESDNDVNGAYRRKALRDMYPQAELYTFHGGGHVPMFSQREQYLAVVQRFLLR